MTLCYKCLRICTGYRAIMFDKFYKRLGIVRVFKCKNPKCESMHFIISNKRMLDGKYMELVDGE